MKPARNAADLSTGRPVSVAHRERRDLRLRRSEPFELLHTTTPRTIATACRRYWAARHVRVLNEGLINCYCYVYAIRLLIPRRTVPGRNHNKGGILDSFAHFALPATDFYGGKKSAI